MIKTQEQLLLRFFVLTGRVPNSKQINPYLCRMGFLSPVGIGT